jgi:hypothetical protein
MEKMGNSQCNDLAWPQLRNQSFPESPLSAGCNHVERLIYRVAKTIEKPLKEPL